MPGPRFFLVFLFCFKLSAGPARYQQVHGLDSLLFLIMAIGAAHCDETVDSGEVLRPCLP